MLLFWKDKDNPSNSNQNNYNYNLIPKNNKKSKKDLIFRQELDAHVVDSFMKNLKIYMQECGEANPSIYRYEEFEV